MIVALIRAWAVGRGVSVSTASRLLSGSGDTVDRMERGMSLTARRAAAIIQKASDHWPTDLEWPPEIPRPEARPGRDEAA